MLSLVDTDWLVEENELLTIANDPLAVVSTLAVLSKLVVLVESEAEVVAKLDDTIAKLAEAVVSILAVDSRLVVLVLSDPDALA